MEKSPIFIKADEVVQNWITKWKKGCLSPEDIRETWSTWISKVANESGELDCRVSKQILKVSIDILKKFIFNGYPTDYANQIGKQEESTICCQVTADYFYNCIECDIASPKRVLCAECFDSSEHRRHKYQIYRRRNLHCCCGETGSWEKPWYCAKHSVPSHQNENDTILGEDLENRIRIVMEAIFLQAECVLCDWDKIKSKSDGDDEKFCVILYNDKSLMDNMQLERLLGNVKKNFSGKQILQIRQTLYNEGKIVFKLSKINCNVLKSNSPGQAIVLHLEDVINKEFAFEMLLYLAELLKCGKNIRTIFTEVVTRPHSVSDLSVTEKILIFSRSLPKCYQDLCRKLLILGTMSQYNTKRSLAKIIIEKYDLIISSLNNIEDQHHSKFLAEIIPQLFGIPSLSHGLIANQNALGVVSNSYLNDNMTKFWAWKNMEEKCEYENFIVTRSKQHTQLILLLLEEVPKTWTKELRSGFMTGLSCFLQMLFNFQDVDSETRKNDQHVEFERDNAPALYIQVQLNLCASYFLKWCGTDAEILAEAYSETMKLFQQEIGCEFGSGRTLGLLNYSALCLPYDSETHPVSICLPLSRFLVGLHLIKLQSCKVTLSSEIVSKMFDSVVNIQVMCAQVIAGMWNRNGDPVRRRIEEYREKSSRVEIFDRDIQILQIAAATTEPNKFLIQLLAKYDLLNWTNRNFEENVSDDEVVNLICLSEHFLGLLISVLIERNVAEVSYITDEERIRHEIIHRLCIKPSSRSELEEYFEWSSLKESCFETVLEEVAIFKKPISTGKFGKYELRTDLFDNFNALFYHYTLEELSEANEFQRQRRKFAKEPDHFPPSALPKLKEFFEPMVGIFQCDVMFHIMGTVLERACELTSSSYSETLLRNVLYLIGYALQEQKSGNYSTLSFTEKAEKWMLLDGLKRVSTIHRRNLPRDLLKWTIGTFKEVVGESETLTNEVSEFKISEKLKRSRATAAKRAKIMEDMSNKQKQFLKNNSEAEPKNRVDLASDEENSSKTPEEVCILCQESQILDPKNEVMVTPGYVQYSTVLCARRDNLSKLANDPLLTSNRGPALYTTSCGHIMHSRCFNIYLENSWEEARRKLLEEKPTGFDFKKQEFLCPLCECLSNVVLPLIPPSQHSVEFSMELTDAILSFTKKLQKKPVRSPLFVWKSLAYTIHVIETSLRDSNRPLLGNLSIRHYVCLENFVKISQVVSLIYPGSKMHSSFVRNLYAMFQGDPIQSATLLNFDMFNLWVIITLSESNPSPVLRLIFVAQIIKILLTTNLDEMVDDGNDDKQRTPFKRILKLLGRKRNCLSENRLWNYVQKACQPFLRCCVIFHSFQSGAPQPAQLTEVGGDTYSNMCSYLGLPQDREELFHVTDVYPIVKIWLNNSYTELISIDPLHINQLMKLPHEYCDLINTASKIKCLSKPFETASDQLVCLLCGEFFCWRPCCLELVNGIMCTQSALHLRKCSPTIFLSLTSSEIVLQQRHKQGVVVPGPYLDNYFENDSYFERAKALYLSIEEYKRLHTLWLNHGILEEISRQLILQSFLDEM